jgi:transposase-like protein/IS1 family transposase
MNEIHCPGCDTRDLKVHTVYTVQRGETRRLYYCTACQCYFSETYGTALAGLRTPLSRIQLILEALNDGLSVNATCRTFHVSKNTIRSWQDRLSPVKDALLLYALCHQFLHQVIEGDELYTKVHANQPPADSPGWTIVLMDRASRFIWDLSCGERDRALFEQAMQTLAQVVQHTNDLTLLTDGERRYGNVLFDICHTVIRTGRRGRPRQTLPEGVQVRVKNKGSQAHRRGPKRPKYQAPQPEHPNTTAPIADHDIHANHVEAFNAALRRRMACYRRKTNTYAKKRSAPMPPGCLLAPAQLRAHAFHDPASASGGFRNRP